MTLTITKHCWWQWQLIFLSKIVFYRLLNITSHVKYKLLPERTRAQSHNLISIITPFFGRFSLHYFTDFMTQTSGWFYSKFLLDNHDNHPVMNCLHCRRSDNVITFERKTVTADIGSLWRERGVQWEYYERVRKGVEVSRLREFLSTWHFRVVFSARMV